MKKSFAVQQHFYNKQGKTERKHLLFDTRVSFRCCCQFFQKTEPRNELHISLVCTIIIMIFYEISLNENKDVKR